VLEKCLVYYDGTEVRKHPDYIGAGQLIFGQEANMAAEREERLKRLFHQYIVVLKNIDEVASNQETPWKGEPFRLIFRLHEKATSLLREMHEVAYLAER